MRSRSESTLAIWLVCVGIGLLFLARGAFQPYAFPLFEHLGRLSYAKIALIINGYVLAQSVCAPRAPAHENAWGAGSLRALCHNRGFLADALRRFAMVLPYGCWGTIIPKYVIDQYHSNGQVWVVYLTSLCTTVIGAHFLAVYLSAKLYRRGFKWEWWSMTSVLLYCVGLLLLMFARNP